ncbi:MAG TPA: TolC family protein, partial [Planctomycetota bacterium]|nr:TolC family protein [Planctomycetota bacterium]
MKLSRFAMSVVLALPVAAQAGQEGRTKSAEMRLSLRECIDLALNHNIDVEISRYQPWIDDQAIQSALGPFDYVFYAETATSRNRLAASSLLAGAPVVIDDSVLLRTGMRRTLPIGAVVDLNYSFNRQQTNSSYATLNPVWQESLGLTLAVPVLQGAGEAANQSPILLARNARRLSVDQFEKMLGDTVFSVQEAYWALVSAIELKRFRDQALELARKLLAENKRRLARGVLARVDVTEAEAGVASQVEGILTAENAVQDAMDRLKRLVDPALLHEEVSILPIDAPPVPETELDERAAIERGLREAFEKRPEYRQVFVQIDSQERIIEKARNDALPRLNAIASGSFTGIEDRFSRAADELRSAGTYSWIAGISLEIPIENRTASGAVRKGELERRRLLLQRRH